ncbi:MULTISPECIES: glycoside hydrolase family 27 protein [Caproicibacterium]|uniref:Alpha-galactosidase n=1 Tax=Caproicibacterium argilliputei TaxID=3030016 RepID=A0AA97D7J8_9FIRM|nr:glycoside hydrolase family 27 protein [Caproicibacterium argilliputei]WOC31789.1 glycoside hydrolase family 27 protein [Caproicibacterium argilliputei]
MLRKKDKVAMTPPMGWNSWDCWAATVNEKQLLENADYMAAHLKPFGWEYVVCDIQWSEPLAGTGEREYRNFARLTLDEYGRQMPAENRFPSAAGGAGFAPIAEKIHSMGLKFGIHIMRGIPRQAVHEHLPVLGTDVTADQVALFHSISCWNGDMYGLDPQKPESQAYYDSIFQLYAAWGVDFVKVDDICNTNMYPNNPYSAEKEIEMIRRAIDRSGRDMVLSLSPGPAVIEKAWHMEKHANMWRVTDDFWDKWELLKAMFERCEVWQKHVSPGCWPDCDMLPLGRIGMGFHSGRKTNFTRAEQVTMMTLWSIFRSPLMMGGNLPDCDNWTLSLLTNAEVLHLLKHSHDACQLVRDDTQAVWTSVDDDEGRYLALFNLCDAQAEVSCPLSELELSSAWVRDLWQKKDLGAVQGSVSALLAPHGAALLKLTRAH